MLVKSTTKNNLHISNLPLSKEWHPTKNGSLTPMNVIAGSNKKVWWKCSKGHEWDAVIYSRNAGRSCPYCGGKKVNDENCLQTLNPSLSKEWHFTKNDGLTPRRSSIP